MKISNAITWLACAIFSSILFSCSGDGIVPLDNHTHSSPSKRAWIEDTALFRRIVDTAHAPTQSILGFAGYVMDVFPHLRYPVGDLSQAILSTANDGKDSLLAIPLHLTGINDRTITLEVRKRDSVIHYLAIKQLVRTESSEFVYVTDIAGSPLLSTQLNYTLEGMVNRKLVAPVTSWATLPERDNIDRALLALLYVERPIDFSSFEQIKREVGGEAQQFILKYPPIDINADGYIDDEEFISALAYDASKIIKQLSQRTQPMWYNGGPPELAGMRLPTNVIPNNMTMANPNGMYLDVVEVTIFDGFMSTKLQEVQVSGGKSSTSNNSDLISFSDFMKREDNIRNGKPPYPGEVNDIAVNDRYHDLARNYRMPEKIGCPQSIFGAGTISGSIALTANVNNAYGGKGKYRPKLASSSLGLIPPQSSGITFFDQRNPLRKNYHDGVDYAAQLGTLVYPMYDEGEVLSVRQPYIYKNPPPYEKDSIMKKEERSGYGNNILIRYKLGEDYVIVRYAHLLYIPGGIVKGRVVNKSDIVAYSGRSGIRNEAAVPHVHVDVFRVAVSDYGSGKKFYITSSGVISEDGKTGAHKYRTNGVLQDPFEYNPTKYTGTRASEGYMFPKYNDGQIQPAFLAKCK